MPAVDHRRATADRNRVAILDAVEAILDEHRALSMAAIATRAGVSRPTLYAHFATLPAVVEAAVARAVEVSVAALDAAEPGDGPAPAALERMLEASWVHLGAFENLARGAAEHLPSDQVERAHAPLIDRATELARRGQAEGAFRDDMPAAWLAHVYYALIHAARVAGHRIGRPAALEHLRTTVRAVFGVER